MQEELTGITALLQSVNQGDTDAESELLSTLYAELRQLAGRYMRRERSDHTLQPTALVNETYLHLVRQGDKVWLNRSHFLAVAAQVMRRVLVDYAHARNLKKGVGNLIRLGVDEQLMTSEQGWEELVLDVDKALKKLRTLDPRQARIIELRYFSGMTAVEIAEVVGVSERTVKRDCQSGRAWLYGELRPTSVIQQEKQELCGA